MHNFSAWRVHSFILAACSAPILSAAQSCARVVVCGVNERFIITHGIELHLDWFFLVGFVAALAQWMFLGDTEIFKRIVDGTFDSAKLA
jgi:hypothetical protein